MRSIVNPAWAVESGIHVNCRDGRDVLERDPFAAPTVTDSLILR